MITRSKKSAIFAFVGIALGSFLAALAIRVFLFPNQVIDGGIVGIALILTKLTDNSYLPIYLIVLNIPFIFLAYKYLRGTFVIQMMIAVLFFAFFLFFLRNTHAFAGDPLEIIVIGGAILGAGVGLIIRNGGCTDGTEIVGILFNRRFGMTVGQVVLFFNIFIFSAYGWIFSDWHSALRSLMTFIVAFKMIDIVIAGLEELKSVMIITTKPEELRDMITHELGLGLTVIPTIGGFSGEHREILLVIVERLDLSELKEKVLETDSSAFMAIENLHEIAYGRHVSSLFIKKKRARKRFYSLN